MRIALAQTNPTVGDVAGNTARILERIDEAADRGARLVVFPELAVIGYPPKDLLLKPDVIEACEEAVEQIARRCTRTTAVIGFPRRAAGRTGLALHNAAAVCREGRRVHTHVKHLLPTYDVFDETRYFEPGPRTDLTRLDRVDLGISVCEDLWNDERMVSRQLYHDNPIEELAARGAQLFINCSASPFVVRKHRFRLKLFAHTSRRYGLPLVYVNQVGGNDELVFDGNSCVVDGSGNLVAHARDFEEDLLVAEVPVPGEAGTAGGAENRIEQARSGLGSVYAALVLGLRDYCRKCGFRSLVVGLSGGIDSAVTACLAADAVGSAQVTGVAMPSRYSSEGSVADAAQLAQNLGIRFHRVPIEGPHSALETVLQPLFGGELSDIAAQNLQARLRGNILMAFSNQEGAMLVTTGNKSEMAVGYCTLYGDMAGGLAVLSDVPKGMVYQLARWINRPSSPLHRVCGRAPIPRSTITKPPSAELRPDQRDQDTLPDYDVLDAIVERYIERHQSVGRIVRQSGLDPATVREVVRLIDRSEYKRRQAAPGLKITSRAFGSGRRMPMAQRYDPGAGAAIAALGAGQKGVPAAQ